MWGGGLGGAPPPTKAKILAGPPQAPPHQKWEKRGKNGPKFWHQKLKIFINLVQSTLEASNGYKKIPNGLIRVFNHHIPLNWCILREN